MSNTKNTNSKILVIDDDLRTLEMMSDAMQRRGYEVLTANSGSRGATMAREAGPDVILLDVTMPDLDGISVCRMIRKAHETRSIPIICMTGDVDPDVKIRCLEAGANDFTTKPVDAVELAARIRNLITFKQIARAKNEWEGTMDCIKDMVILVDADGIIRRCNKATADFFNMFCRDVIGNNWLALFKASGVSIELAQDRLLDVCQAATGTSYEVALYPGRDDLYVQSTVITVRNTTDIKQLTASLNRKTHELTLDRDRLESLLRLGEMDAASQSTLVEYALESAVRLTESSGGYLHFLNAGESSIELYAWSKNVLSICKAAQDSHYPLGSAGVWADSIRKREPVIHNDYPAYPEKKGLPEGHFPILRHISVPVFDGKTIVAVAGVGNKELPYTQDDVRQVALFMNELWKLIKQQRLDRQLKQQEKMASIGQLAAGIAHEINNPTGYILSNLGTLQKYAVNLAEFIRCQNDALAGLPEHCNEVVVRKRNTLKIDYILNDLNNLIQESQDGADRIRKIVQDMKGFSRINETEQKAADINAGIESTINIVWNELKYKAVVKRCYGALPHTVCNLSQINQVFMNLLINAAHAIEKNGEIRISTWTENGSIMASVEDTGCGISPANLPRIFEPFFTTKAVGKGTGLGLSIAYEIMKKHNGDIQVSSEVGRGTKFTVTLPITQDTAV